MIRVRYFARLRDDLDCAEESIALPEDVITAAGLRAHLAARGGAWANALAPGKAVRIAVNQEMAQGEAPVRAGDEIAFFPPVTGG